MDLIDSSPGILHIRVRRSEQQKNYTLAFDKPSSTHCNGSRKKYFIEKSKTQVWVKTYTIYNAQVFDIKVYYQNKYTLGLTNISAASTKILILKIQI